MMLNVVVLNGRLTAAPELKYTTNNIAVTSFTLAVERTFSGRNEERITDFINIVAWSSTAEFVSRYFQKGQLVAVQGSLKTRNYTDKDGIKHRIYEVVADQVHFAEAKRNEAARPVSNNAAPEPSNNFNEYQAYTEDDDLPF